MRYTAFSDVKEQPLHLYRMWLKTEEKPAIVI